MSRLQKFITEYKNTKISDEGKLDGLIDKHCSKAFNAYQHGRATIYKGFDSGTPDYFITDPSQGAERKSRFADSNHYTLLIDNLPSWHGFPKRSKSLICTTDQDNAEERSAGNGSHVILPFDNTEIAVCPEEDIWISFPYLGKDQWYSAHLNQLNRFFKKHDVEESGFPDNLKKITNKNKYIEFTGEDIAYLGDKVFQDHFIDVKKTITLYDYLNDRMNPLKNGFGIVKPGESLPDRREVWMEGKCIVIRIEVFSSIWG